MGAIIYKPSKTATQSGQKQAEKWLLEFERSKTNRDYLMGWFGSDDTSNQVRIPFNSKEDAIAFASKNKISYRVLELTLVDLEDLLQGELQHHPSLVKVRDCSI